MTNFRRFLNFRSSPNTNGNNPPDNKCRFGEISLIEIRGHHFRLFLQFICHKNKLLQFIRSTKMSAMAQKGSLCPLRSIDGQLCRVHVSTRSYRLNGLWEKKLAFIPFYIRYCHWSLAVGCRCALSSIRMHKNNKLSDSPRKMNGGVIYQRE